MERDFMQNDYTSPLRFTCSLLCWNAYTNNIYEYRIPQAKQDDLRRWYMNSFYPMLMSLAEGSDIEFPMLEKTYEKYRAEDKYYMLKYNSLWGGTDDFVHYLTCYWLEKDCSVWKTVTENYKDRFGRIQQSTSYDYYIYKFPMVSNEIKKNISLQIESPGSKMILEAIHETLDGFNKRFA